MSDFRRRVNDSFRVWSLCVLGLGIGFYALAPKDTVADIFGEGDDTFEMEFVTIGNPGNAPDLDNNPNSYRGRPGATPVGGVAYEYRIGKYEVSRDQVTKATALGNLPITMLDMTQVGLNLLNPTKNEPELPATGINWYEAATFVNWLNASEGHPEAYKVRDGVFKVWEPGDAGYDATNIFRNSQAHYFLPSVHEWYKAAFYDPEKDYYYQFPTGSDSPPVRVASGTDPDSAIYHQRRPAFIHQTGGLSPYGTRGQGGSVWEWEETEYNHVNRNIDGMRGLRSGDWGTDAEHISANYRNPFPPGIENQLMSFGFRVASIVKPNKRGDFNGNGLLDAGDIDMIAPRSVNLDLDLTSDGVVNGDDREFWVHELARTWMGDANLDGSFSTDDLVSVFQAGQYEDDLVDNSGWNAGDWNGDADFTSQDLVLAFQDGGYEKGPRPDPVVVPEPMGVNLCWLMSVVAWSVGRRTRGC